MIKVLKFGGSSVADATRMSQVLDIVHSALGQGRVLLVSSAISGCTDALIEIGREKNPSERGRRAELLLQRHRDIARRLFTGSERQEMFCELDALFKELSSAPAEACETFGELFSTKILARKFACEGVRVKWIDSRSIVRKKGGSVDEVLTYENIRRAVDASPEAELFVAPGFIASDEDGRVATLGRGGSDYTAALFAAGVSADSLEIWTDVPGMMTANPKVVRKAETIPEITYEAAFSLAEQGAKVLYAPAVGPAMKAGIAFYIKNTFAPGHPGTLVCGHSEPGKGVWKGVTSQVDRAGGEAVVALVGEGNPSSVASRVRAALADSGVQPLSPIEESENLCRLRVRANAENLAVEAVHREFFESGKLAAVPLFLAGYGAVGKELVRLVGESSKRIANRRGRTLKLAGLANSRRFVIDLKGISPSEAAGRLESGQEYAGDSFIDAVLEVAPRGSIFIDCTDDFNIHTWYARLFRGGINIVTSNRRSLSLPYVEYAAIKTEARQNGTFFRYDTTVGNSLPILESIAGDANCSDGIESIEALVSCTLNYIITSHDGSETMADILRRAQVEGLTETDPRTDLGGGDVLRKLLILAREAGVPLEEDDVEIVPMLGKEFFDCSLSEFYRRLEEYEPELLARERELASKNLRERFVASLYRDPASGLGFRAQIKMLTCSPESPFYWIDGTENVIVVRSERSAPLVVKGAGEGARQAAIGIIKDMLM